jgi:acetyl esterase
LDQLAPFPPTLILTAEYDTLRHEMNDLAADLHAKSVPITNRQFDGVDHGFTHTKSAEVAREAITMIADLLRKAHA